MIIFSFNFEIKVSDVSKYYILLPNPLSLDIFFVSLHNPFVFMKVNLMDTKVNKDKDLIQNCSRTSTHH